VSWWNLGVVNGDVASRGVVVITCDMVKNVGQDGVQEGTHWGAVVVSRSVAGLLGTRRCLLLSQGWLEWLALALADGMLRRQRGPERGADG
jgi:hypothetical protein